MMVQQSRFTKIGRASLLLFGVMCGSSAVILIKASTEHPFLVAAYRLLIAAVILVPFYLRDLNQWQGPYGKKEIGWSALPAFVLALHFTSWVVGARMAPVANASLIINLTPVAMPFFLWVFYRERVSKIEVVGTAFTLLGLLILTSANLHMSRENFYGDLVCFGSMLAFAAYLALGRKNGPRLSLWLYMVPLYFIAGLVCLACGAVQVNPVKSYTIQNILLIVGLGIIPTVFGHTILNYSMKFFRGQVVSVTNLSQPIFAGVLGFLIFGEVPQPVFFLAASIVLGGVLIVLNAGWIERRRQMVSGQESKEILEKGVIKE
jgi:drug/metabolite transporter (DMT)-like permease